MNCESSDLELVNGYSDSPLIKLPNTYRAFYSSFRSLKVNQKESITPILAGKDFVLQAATGSGKTEAVLAPCLERIIQSGTKKSIIYVVPTRALALDMERRLAPILVDKLGLSLGIRTGDAKRFSGGSPDLLLTTPESLDVMLGSSNADFRTFFQQIGAVILDEVHSLTYTYRGEQLVCLLIRIEHRSARFQRIALSATIGSVEEVVSFFNFKTGTADLAASVQREIIPHLVQLKDDQELAALVDDLYREWNYKKILIFTNNRGACDRIFILLSEQGSFQGKVELHYSNLNTKERRKVEERFRTNRHALCVATSTLELGIDIGDVDVVLLYEPPDSVSAFLQRIGRGNRRKAHTHFWGISRGPQAGRQLLRFLGLLNLSQKGEIELHTVKRLHSVLIQQTLSCLYEKKQISLPALQKLFPKRADVMAQIFERLSHQKWLRPAQFKGMFRGGWRYRDLLLEYKIWSNFPEVEEDYSLEVAGESIADIPASVVRQLEPGDCVTLTGKRLKVLQIVESKKRKILFAEPVEKLDDKEIFWLGCGFRASFEVAQAIKELLNKPDHGKKDLGLFSRTSKLLESEIAQIEDAVVLMNGIMVSRKTNGLYRYWTFLGSMGNLVLQWCIDHGPGIELEEFYIASDETGLDCSHLIDFKKLNLPEDKKEFQAWVRKHAKPLQALVAINSFARFLPRTLFIEELTDFLFDQRITNIFSGYLTLSSEIKSGDPAILELTPSTLTKTTVKVVREVSVEPILNREKLRWKIKKELFIISPEVKYKKRPLTGTIIGEFIRHQQCNRWLGYTFVPNEELPPGSTISNKEFGKSRIERGRVHEREVMENLRTQCDALVTIKDADANGNITSLDKRAESTIVQLKFFIREIKAAPEKIFMLAQPVLIHPLYQKGCLENGLGIPDVIRITMQNSAIVLEVCDIKDSNLPHYYQKWQIVFYAFLLQSLIGRLVLRDVHVSLNGVLLTRSDLENKMSVHFFDLAPYLASLPTLLEQVNSTLQKNISHLGCNLNTHCTSCPYFDHCYMNALHNEDVLFVPQLTQGTLEKLRMRGLKNVETTYTAVGNEEIFFSPHQQHCTEEALSAFKKNRISLREEKTRLFPVNISTSIFLHILENPYSGLPYSFALEARGKDGEIIESRYWIFIEEENLHKTWREFADELTKIWVKYISKNRGPHIFYFGEQQRLYLENEETSALQLIKNLQSEYHTDIARVLTVHFYFPIPGRLTLSALARVLQLKPELESLETLFHSNSISTFSKESTSNSEQKERAYLKDLMELNARMRQWMVSHLRSQWKQDNWDICRTEESWEKSFLNFIDEERRLREEDVHTLQARPLDERIDSFRAIGPLKYLKTSINDEGKPLYGFTFDPENFSKFRQGDFLKLAPIGLSNLQEGLSVILSSYDQNKGELWLVSRTGKLLFNKTMTYSLEEDASDWNSPRLAHILKTVFSKGNAHSLGRMLQGKIYVEKNTEEALQVETWLKASQGINLNATQQQALMLPFRNSLGLVEGPPGTGKTYLLAWTIIALIQRAQEKNTPLRIVVSALTHKAIDQVLNKVNQLVNIHKLENFKGECYKWGRQIEGLEEEGKNKVQQLHNKEALKSPYLILGATGFGLYQLLEGEKGQFPQIFDWVIFDEASQVLIPQALLSLIYGKGRFLFFGDIKQLPPIVMGNYKKKTQTIPISSSILSCLLDSYGDDHCVQLDQTYRMNKEICKLPGKIWYKENLYPAKGNANSRITLQSYTKNDLLSQLLNPEQPVTLLLMNHRGNHQKSDDEAKLISRLTERLLKKHGLKNDQIAIISPHRAQNNTIAKLLEPLREEYDLPVVDTVERMQGAERDLIIFSLTTSDCDHIGSSFLNNPNRFNVVITRAKKKLIVVGSQVFFSHIARNEESLVDNACFKAFFDYCKKHDSLFYL